MSEFLTIVRAVYSGLSRRKVAAMHKVSRNTVSLYLRQARDQGWLTLEDLEKLDDLTVSQGVSQIASPSRDTSFRMPDFDYVHSELAKPHVTLKLLWEEYVEECRRNGERFYMETQFRQYYHKHAKVHKATIRLEHKPALTLEVDWAGTRIAFFDEESGKPEEAFLFVAVLPCTRIIYAEPFRDEKMPSWISGHVHAFQYLGGVPKTLVPDNLKCGVKRANFYEPDLNRTYQEMAAYYGTVILPARVRKPKDKPSAENAVLIASRKIIAGLRNVQILSFADLQRHVRSGLEQVNSAPLAGKSESRWTSFLAEEKDFLLPLPQSSYEPAEWGKAKVQPNCHVAYQRKFYSVPFEYLGEEVDVRATRQTVELFYHHQRIASHRRLWGKEGYSTVNEHMPPDKLFFADWNRDRFLGWAGKTGDCTRRVVEAILDRAAIEQQAYRSCFGVMSLGEKFGSRRLERASGILLSRTPSPSYGQLKSILEKNLDVTESEQDVSMVPVEAMKKSSGRGFRRGADYFGGRGHA